VRCIGSNRVLGERKREREVLSPRDTNRDPVGRGTTSAYPFVEGMLGLALADQLPCQPNIQSLITMKVGDLTIPGKEGVSVALWGRVSDHPGNLYKPASELVPNRHRTMSRQSAG
jgi:hypothetical protein